MENKIDLIQLENSNVRLTATNYGCHIMKLEIKDRKGEFINTVITLNDIEEYKHQDKYIGALVGRVANRIGEGKFTLNGIDYTLACNNGPNHLHGGINGFNSKIFGYKKETDRILFSYTSPDGEEGYPGTLTLKVAYILTEKGIKIEYEAVSDKDTLINLTNHSYFTLGAESAHDLRLQINSSEYVLNDENGMATGVHRNVTDTAFDFRNMKSVGKDIMDKDTQLIMARGYDHAFRLDGTENQITLYNEANGITMHTTTTMPYCHVYTANFLDGQKGENGKLYYERSGICLETEYMPNGINNGNSNGIILSKNTLWKSSTEYSFTITK